MICPNRYLVLVSLIISIFPEKNFFKSLPVSPIALSLPSAFKKACTDLSKSLDFHAKRIGFCWKINLEKFGRNKLALTFALPFQKRVGWKRPKIFESWETIALILVSYESETKR
ncbi:MAG: hypothetical protein EBR19_06260 [Chitinophagaceae bacterium]|nr:hypothetical protein [Chitinophagaceae bacterium]